MNFTLRKRLFLNTNDRDIECWAWLGLAVSLIFLAIYLAVYSENNPTSFLNKVLNGEQLVGFMPIIVLLEFTYFTSFLCLLYKFILVRFVDYPHAFWAENVAKSIANSLSKEQREVIIKSELFMDRKKYQNTCFGGIRWFDDIKGKKCSNDEIIFYLVLDGYLFANKTIGFTICKKRLYKGELCEKYVAYFLFKARYRLEKDIEIQAKFLKKKELENKKTYECNANAKSLGMCKERV